MASPFDGLRPFEWLRRLMGYARLNAYAFEWLRRFNVLRPFEWLRRLIGLCPFECLTAFEWLRRFNGLRPFEWLRRLNGLRQFEGLKVQSSTHQSKIVIRKS